MTTSARLAATDLGHVNVAPVVRGDGAPAIEEARRIFALQQAAHWGIARTTAGERRAKGREPGRTSGREKSAEAPGRQVAKR